MSNTQKKSAKNPQLHDLLLLAKSYAMDRDADCIEEEDLYEALRAFHLRGNQKAIREILEPDGYRKLLAQHTAGDRPLSAEEFGDRRERADGVGKLSLSEEAWELALNIGKLRLERVVAADGRGDGEREKEFELVGRSELCRRLNDEVINLARRPEAYAPFGVKAPASLLFYGEPGCGKTYAADKLVEFLGWPCVRITGAVYSSNAHENFIRQHFERAFKAKATEGHAVVVMDELDSFLYPRDRDCGRNRSAKLTQT